MFIGVGEVFILEVGRKKKKERERKFPRERESRLGRGIERGMEGESDR